MRRILYACLGVFLLGVGPALAADEWGLAGEKTARFEAKVVDVLCELTGDCPAKCGGGKRQLGLLNSAGKLTLPLKNQTLFSGAALELIDFCGKQVIADGLMITNRGYTFFALQFVREAPDGKWRKANRFLGKWAKANGIPANSDKVDQWYEHDPNVKRVLAKDGKLGLGLAADRAYDKTQK